MVKKMSPSQGSPYKIAAAARRSKMAARNLLILDEVKPVQGRIHATLSGKIGAGKQPTSVFGPSSIDIPEFSRFRRDKSK
jgi:hypothetical protein